jgi:sugar lactone lactonase YvrE
MTYTAPSSHAAPQRVIRRRSLFGIAVLTVVLAILGAVASARAATPSLYVTNGFGDPHPSRITGYAAGASGDAAPITNLAGAATGLNAPFGVARDGQGLVWVSNSSSAGSLTAYAATATGNTAPAATISGPDTGLHAPAGLAFGPDGGAVVANTFSTSITEYAPGARGDASPVATIAGADTGLDNPNGVAFDATGDLFVTNAGNSSVTEYAPGASGDATPIATLQGAATGLSVPDAVAFDLTGRMYVANFSGKSITEYVPGAHGNATPVATISGAATTLNEPLGLGFDSAGNLFVAEFSNAVLVFAPGANGNVAPKGVISGAGTGLDGPQGLLVSTVPGVLTPPAAAGTSQSTATLEAMVAPRGNPTSYHFEYGATTAYGSSGPTTNIGAGANPRDAFTTISGLTPGTTYHFRVVATNAAGTVYGGDRTFTTAAGGLTSTPMRYVSNAPGFGPSNTAGQPAAILGFPAGARGNIAPTVTISGSQTLLTSPTGVAVDAAGDVFAADFAGNQVLEFAPGARGNVAPIARIPIPDQGNPFGLALSPTGKLLVSTLSGGHVYEFAKSATGAWGVLHTIGGAATGFTHPAGVAFGAAGTILVADDVNQAGSVREFAANADGNAAPIRTIAGAATGFSQPLGLAVDAAGTVYVADTSDGAVSAFAPGARGNVAPVRSLSGTSMESSDALALDGAGHLLVADGTGHLEDFGTGASGKNQVPLATIAGSQTGIIAPFGVAISPPLLGVSTASLSSGTTGSAYSQKLAATGGAPPYTWSLAAGTLPSGLTLNPSTGAITGSPTTAGTSSFTVKVSDVSQPTAQFATEALSIAVHPPVLPSVFTANGGSGTVTDYALTDNGNVAPLLTLGQGNKLLAPSGVAVDTTGRLYVVNAGANSVSVFPAGASSSSSPDRTIAGSSTGLANPAAIALDGAGRIYVVSQSGNSISVFAANANGNVAPVATIAGSSTGLYGPTSATVTSSGDVWVANANNNSLTEYAPGANGNVAPIAIVSGPSTDLNSPAGIGQDEHGNLLVANLYGESIVRFAPGSIGNAVPTGIIAGGSTGLDFPHGVDVDAQGRIYVPNEFGNSISVFAADASGDVAPVATIAGGATGLSSPVAVAVVPPLSILTKRLPTGTVGHLYRVPIHAALGTPPYRWLLKRHRLPHSIRLTRAGTLSGVPHRPGRWRVTIRVIDAGQPAMTDSHTFTLRVRCPRVGHRRSCVLRRHSRHQRNPFHLRPGGSSAGSPPRSRADR